MKYAFPTSVAIICIALLYACDGSLGNADSCDNICAWNADCMLNYFESERVCETRCLNDEANGVRQETWNELRRCTAKYREYYLCLELQNCIDAIEDLESITDGYQTSAADGDSA